MTTDFLPAQILVEMQPTFPPRPVWFAIRQNDRIIATLSLEQVEQALREFHHMKAVRDRVDARYNSCKTENENR